MHLGLSDRMFRAVLQIGIFGGMAKAKAKQVLFTIGHSNQPLESFLALLAGQGIRFLADIRRYPGSRRWPWFGRDSLPGSLAAQGIAYRHFPSLGGRRKPEADSPNGAWRVPQFQAYADYMATPEFRAGLDELLDLIPQGPLTILCAEALPWRCHRNLLSDSVLIRGVPVFHILSSGKLKPHALPDFARVDTGEDPPRITYPPLEGVQAKLL
jgi:uncharacterized protein (DUF488 family)